MFYVPIIVQLGSLVFDFSLPPLRVPLQSQCDSTSQCCMLADMLCTPWWLICFVGGQIEG